MLSTQAHTYQQVFQHGVGRDSKDLGSSDLLQAELQLVSKHRIRILLLFRVTLCFYQVMQKEKILNFNLEGRKDRTNKERKDAQIGAKALNLHLS